MAEAMELIVNDFQEVNEITFNYEDLKRELTLRVEKYKGITYTEETIKDAKADRALLNKVSKAINDQKKRIKDELLKPYTDFENKCKELMSIVDEVSKGIDEQVKAFEQSEKSEKLQVILEYWLENSGEFSEMINVDKLVKDEWLNKSYSMTKIKQEIDHIISKTKMDMATLDSTITDENLNKQVKIFYLDNIDNASNLSLAIQEGNRLKEQCQKLDSIEEKIEPVEKAVVSENPEIKCVDFRVWGTVEQLKNLSQYLKENNLKVGKVV